MLSRKKKMLIMFVIAVTSFAVVVIISILLQRPKERVDINGIASETEKATSTQNPKTKAEMIAEDFAEKSTTKLSVLSASTVYEEGGFSVIDMRFITKSGVIRSTAVAQGESIIIPPSSDYTQETINAFSIPDSVIKALQEEVAKSE